MKIGILTLPLYTNYGGILQAWALQTVIERMGHDVEEINIKRIKPGFLGKVRSFISPIKSFVINCIPSFKKKNIQQDYYCRPFINKHIKRRSFNGFDSIPSNRYDAIIVGSDQIWRDKYFQTAYSSSINNAFLSFVKKEDIKKIAYAASFGLEEWQWKESQTEDIKKLLKGFNAISVRESSAVVLLEDYASCQAEHVLDPTLLLDAKKYISLFKPKAFSSKCLMTYILDETTEKLMLVQKIGQELQLNVFKSNNNHQYDLNLPISDRIQPPVEDWLNGFYQSEFIVTDSFHACVFSILFNKPFVAIGNKDRGLSRFYSLLKMFNQEHRLFTDLSKVQLTDEILAKPNCDVDTIRTKSLNFLTRSLCL